VVASTVHDLNKYYPPNRIFLPQLIANAVDHIKADLIRAAYRFKQSVEFSSVPGGQSPTDWSDIYDEVSSEIKTAKAALESEFRRLMGDT
jgi:hypothetical protein